MKKGILLLLILYSCFAEAQSLSLYQKENIRSKAGFLLPYRILYPENYDPERAYPLVLFLHGVLERGRDNEQQLINGAKLFLKEENRKDYPAIVIFPQCPPESYWATVAIESNQYPIRIRFRYEEPPVAALEACMQLVEKLVEDKKADSRRLYIMGLSMGGMGTLEAISRYPDMFAAAVPMCGAGDTSYCSRYAGKVALWLFHGAEDKGIDPECSRSVVRTLKASGATVRYTEYPQTGHNCWDSALAEPTLVSWMFQQRLRKRKKR